LVYLLHHFDSVSRCLEEVCLKPVYGLKAENHASEGERKEKGISQFEAYLADQGVKHILCRVNHPQTNGKLERFHGVYDQKKHQLKSIDEYVQWHNEIKPHLSLNIETLETPIQAFQRKLPLEKTERIETTEPLVKK
jgi:hypothetical protein